MQVRMGYEDRLKRQEANERLILTFIASEGFSTAQMLAELLGYKHPQSVYKILRRLEEKKFLRTYKMDFIGNLYLLTPRGISQIDDASYIKSIKVHEIKPHSMAHRLAIQQCHIAMKKNKIRWGSSTGKIKKGQQKPDAVIWFCYNKAEKSEIAIEVELTIKTRKRYYEIYGAYTRSKYPVILYLVPHSTMKNRLSAMLNDIADKHPHGVNYPLNNTKMQVFTFDEFAKTITAEYSDKRGKENKEKAEKRQAQQSIDANTEQQKLAEKARLQREEQERINRKYEEEQRVLFPEPVQKKKRFGLF
jgi:DNA-binding PadR family transcriptional regulator